MKFLLPTLLFMACLGFGCTTENKLASYGDVPPASNVDPSLGSLASLTGTKIYEQHDEEKSGKRSKQSKKTTIENPIVTPESGLTGKVMVYNARGRFVVLSFPFGRLPALDTPLFVYRNGLKSGEVKITGPQRDNNIVADLVTGEAQPGDEVRDK